MRLSNAERMRAADAEAIGVRGIPSTLLMERAAAVLAEEAAALAGGKKSAVVFCGSGNNGGDGVCAARFLMQKGFIVRALLCGRRKHMTADTLEMERRLEEFGGCLEDFNPQGAGLRSDLFDCGVIIDAIFGIGLSRPVSGKALEAIALINEAAVLGGVPVVSADIASGVAADSGQILGSAVKAAATVTFSMAKPGHFAEPGCTCCGKLMVGDIGIPRDILKKSGTDVFALRDGEVFLPFRDPLSHKGDHGKLLVFGGSAGYTGAPSLCARAAVRAGAGLVFLGVPDKIYPITAVKNDEAMPFPLLGTPEGRLSPEAELPLDRLRDCDVCAAGPGLGRCEGARRLVRWLIENSEVPLVLDADALWALSEEPDLLKAAKVPVILTPHAGEYARLGGDISAGRLESAREFARKRGCVLVLKGHRTICAFPDGMAYISTHGNPGMAKGGTGDVLTGVVAAMLGQIHDVKRAVTTGVFLHGLAGDLAAEEKGEYGLTASDMIETLPKAALEIAPN